MTARELFAARRARKWTQVEASKRLGVSQPYLAMLERGQRRLPANLALRAAKRYGAPPTTVPRLSRNRPTQLHGATLARDFARLGYPGFGYLRSRNWTPKNPGDVLLTALGQNDLEARVVEALPWLVLRYWMLDWDWVVSEAKVRDLQNRLGFVVNLARQLSERAPDPRRTRTLAAVEARLYRSRLAREDTLCRASLADAEHRWLADQRSEAARQWNLLTDWTADALRYTA